MIGKFKDAHIGETMVIIGNGPGLKNIPFAFLEAYPNIALNFFPTQTPWIRTDYWAALDPLCAINITRLPPSVPKFLSPWAAERAKSEGWEAENLYVGMFQEKIKGLMWSDGTQKGVRYSSSIIYASHIAVEMGAKEILWVGFDCTYRADPSNKLDEDEVLETGRSNVPHYFHDIAGKFQESWCREAGVFAEWARRERGVNLFNLSIPTQCGTVPLAHYLRWWSEPKQLQEVKQG